MVVCVGSLLFDGPEVCATDGDHWKCVVILADRSGGNVGYLADDGEQSAAAVDHGVGKTGKAGDETAMATAFGLGFAVVPERLARYLYPGL